MSKEIFKINKRKNLREITQGKKTKEIKSDLVEDSAVVAESSVAVEQNIAVSPEKKKGFFESKIKGAIAEIFRRKELDETVENNLSQGLDANPDFIAASAKIDKKRNWINSVYHKYLTKQLEGDENISIEEIEKEISLTNEEIESSLPALDTEKSISNEPENSNIINEPNFVNPFNEKISKYSESIGITAEELASVRGFENLSPEQQQFALETLRRSSLAKAKVEAHETFTQEKASKKWWEIGFSMNQNYHKERHKIEAVKNIESRGLAGYGEVELTWLTDVIKDGPEVKINKAGEVVVDCLHSNEFSDEQKVLAAKYNEVARNYIEHKTKNKETDDETRDFIQKLNVLSSAILKENKDDFKNAELNNLLLKSKNNIDLLKFLSADQETEKLLNKMSDTSLTGFSKAKAMALGQSDKAGYSTLGFAIRTGSKFALANSAYLASAISYSVAPMAAAIVGGFRAYNSGKKELSERDELAKLGVTDKSDTAKVMNLAAGTKEGVNFGLVEKLQAQINDLESLRSNNDYSSAEIQEKIERLNLRISYTEKQINRDEVNYGSVEDRGINYFNLVNTLAEAKSMVGSIVSHYKPAEYWFNDENEKLLRYNKRIDLSSFNLEKMENESQADYQKRLSENKDFNKYKAWVNDENRLKELSKMSASSRLASFMNYKEDKQNKKEFNFLLKKTVKGAVMGASFAAIGSFIAGHLGLGHPLNSDSNKADSSEVVDTAKKIVSSNSVVKTETITNTAQETVKVSPVTHIHKVIEHSNPVEVRRVEVPMEEIKTPVQGIEVEHAPTVVEVDHNIPAEHSPVINESDHSISADESASQEVVDAKVTANAYKNVMNFNNKAAKLADGVYSNNSEFRTEEAFIKQITDSNNGVKLTADEELEAKIIWQNFQANKDYNILRSRLVGLETKISNDNITTTETLTNSTETPVQETNSISTTEAAPVNPVKNIIEPAHQEITDVKVSTEDIKPVTSSNIEVPTKTLEEIENTHIADTSSIANELHIKPESLHQVGDDLVYQGNEKSNVVFDLKFGGIKEASDISGKKIPNEFVHDLINGKKLAKFTRNGGLEKIFSAWTKLNSNDKLVYESLSWFNKKTLSPEDLLTQIKGIYQVNTENIYVDAANKQFISSSGRKFEMTLKGVKKLVSFLPRK